MTIFGDGPSTVFKLSDYPNTANVEAGWMCPLDGTASAPLALKDNIIVGASGGDQGVRDWIISLDPKTGKLVEVKGLARRRAAEAALYATPDETVKSSSTSRLASRHTT